MPLALTLTQTLALTRWAAAAAVQAMAGGVEATPKQQLGGEGGQAAHVCGAGATPKPYLIQTLTP